MKTWRVDVTKQFVVPDAKMKTIEALIQGVGGELVIDQVKWDGTYAVHAKGYMETDSIHVANRIVKLVHSFGGRVRLHVVSDRSWSPRKQGGYRRHKVPVGIR